MALLLFFHKFHQVAALFTLPLFAKSRVSCYVIYVRSQSHYDVISYYVEPFTQNKFAGSSTLLHTEVAER